MKKLLMGLALFAMVFSGCAGTSDDPEALDNALVGFTSCVQSSRWQEALEYVTSDEASQISPDGYEFKEEYQVAARRLPLSTLRKAGLKVDGHGRLVGIKAAMDEANERYVMSEEQAKVGTNLEEMEKQRIQRRLEEGQKILQGEEEEAKAEPEVEVFTNKLTEEEKRKYGSTRDLQAPEEYKDENTEEAEEQIFNGDYESNE
ncbi:hypothetical protein [uncultured Fibrobacter sp.]|uniref:hypothetical protein n=1 Tax=uncultured Fibrobacter sp. TaxID=261512 RepID=UPI001566144F|nr:hypothetical protein [uncultured Fibrobacter sp.]